MTTTHGNEYSIQSMTSLLDISQISISDTETQAKFDAKFEKIWSSIL